MNKVIVRATGDIPNESIQTLINDIGSDNCEDSISRRMLFSAEPPSFIEIVGDLISWKTVFVASATVFFSTLSKRLADDVYDNIIVDTVFDSVRNLAKSIARFIKESPKNSFVKIGLHTPRGVKAPYLFIEDGSEAEIAFQCSCIYAVSDKIIETLVDLSERYDRYLTPARLTVSNDGTVKIECYAGNDNDFICITLPILAPEYSE